MKAGARPAVIAHRGASGYAPENTLASFAKALEMGALSMEFDVQQSKDGRLPVIHDTDLKRVAGAKKAIRSLAYPRLSSYDVGAWFSPRFKGEKIPLLEEVLDFVESRAPGEVELHLEIKHGLLPYRGLEERVLGVLASRPQWRGRVIASSFRHRTLHELRARDSRVRLGYLVGMTRRGAALKEAGRLGCESVHLSRKQVDGAWVQSIHAAGFKAFVYTINTAAECRRMADMGVDAVFSNYPDLLELE